MDKITHQVRAEHWTRILNECMNSGMSKTAWCRANGISEKQFFYWQRILRREAYEASQNPSLPAVTEAGQLSAVQQSVSFAANSHFLRTAGPHFPDSQSHIKRTA